MSSVGDLLHKAWFAKAYGYPIIGWLFTILLFSIIAFIIIGTVLFGMEIGSKCDQYICIREY